MSFPEGNNLADLGDGNANVIIENRDNSSSNSAGNLYSSISNYTSQHGNSTSFITVYSDDEDEKHLDRETNWTELPSPAIENIYSFLSRTDQSRMSQVCSRWTKDFNSPILWKTITFYLPEEDYSSEIYPEVRFARKYAHMFQNVEIICKSVKIRLIAVIYRQLKLFLQAIASSSQLISIKFIKMYNYFRRMDDALYQDLFQDIITFFSSQKNLKTVVFQDSRFRKEEGMELLKAILHNNNSTMRYLSLQGFVNETQFAIPNQQYRTNLLSVCEGISKVRALKVDYTQIFEDIMNCLSAKISSGEYQFDEEKCGLRSLDIYCKGKDHIGFRGIPPGTWKHLRDVFRDLNVEMEITIHSHLNIEMEKFLVKETPLKVLKFRYEKFSTPSRINISSFITHIRICKFGGHLEALNILWIPSNVDFARSIVPFVQSCRKLQYLHIHVSYVPSEIRNILMDLLENHPTSLRSITLWFSFLNSNHTEDNLRTLSEEFHSLFEEQGIECFLLVDHKRSLRNRA